MNNASNNYCCINCKLHRAKLATMHSLSAGLGVVLVAEPSPMFIVSSHFITQFHCFHDYFRQSDLIVRLVPFRAESRHQYTNNGSFY